MNSLWILLAIMAVLAVALFTYVFLRDRRRMPSGDDAAAGRLAASEAERYAAERHAHQGSLGDPHRPDGASGSF